MESLQLRQSCTPDVVPIFLTLGKDGVVTTTFSSEVEAVRDCLEEDQKLPSVSFGTFVDGVSQLNICLQPGFFNHLPPEASPSSGAVPRAFGKH